MPEPLLDRPNRSYEHVFLPTKRGRYFYDAGAVAEQPFSDHPSAPEGPIDLDSSNMSKAASIAGQQLAKAGFIRTKTARCGSSRRYQS